MRRSIHNNYIFICISIISDEIRQNNLWHTKCVPRWSKTVRTITNEKPDKRKQLNNEHLESSRKMFINA